MTNYTEIYNQIKEEIELKVSGKKKGITTGIPQLDNAIGYQDKGQVHVIGGFPGSGKSFWLLNEIDGIFDAVKADEDFIPKIVIFSTELSAYQYVKRHIFMRAGMWAYELDKDPVGAVAHLQRYVENYFEERILNQESLNIFGDISSVEEIEKDMDQLIKSGFNPDVVYIDYIQELSIKGKIGEDNTMTMLPVYFKNFAKKYQTSVRLVSQMNVSNYKTRDPNSDVLPSFSYGKQLTQVAHSAIELTRKKGADGKFLDVIRMQIVKAREGSLGYNYLKLNKGFKLAFLSRVEAIALGLEK